MVNLITFTEMEERLNGESQVAPGNTLKQPWSSKYNMKDAVKLPVDEEPFEWIAHNIFNFHKQICMLYGTINEFCTATSCPEMTAGKKYKYLWSEWPHNNHTASNYIHHLLDWVQEQLDDRSVFPSAQGDKFPENFIEICQTICRRLFRVYAHIYHHHSQELIKLEEVAHMNTSLKHFIYFVQEFNLVTTNELEPLKDFVQNLEDKQQVTGVDTLNNTRR